ncbi:MAG: DUF2851 family protein [Verrucomicrobia bacterium]|nr:DUF2851 family protein [Verrucomicrobiota bacterium]
MDRAPQSGSAVAEVQGLYGPFSFPERLLQKIWLRGDFDRTGARTLDGRRVVIRHPGRWNLLGGPDFRGARIGFDGEPEPEGDIELHLHAADWGAHAHAADPAYARVMLHVVLFPPPAGHVTTGAGGRVIPVLVLLPLLHHDLEEYAAEEAVEILAGRAGARLPDELAKLDPVERNLRLRRQADARWRQKVHFARLRLQRLEWEAACHAVALEILGFRFNRAPMLRIAARWPYAEWAHGGVDVDAVWAAEREGWSLQGVRPANHPRTRLRQYAGWVRACSGWPGRLRELGDCWPEVSADGETRAARRRHAFGALRETIARELCGGVVSGPRLDSLICDGFLPLLAVATARERHGLWFHWFPADLPPFVVRGLKELAVFDGRTQPASHGMAQGMLGWWIEREGRTTEG